MGNTRYGCGFHGDTRSAAQYYDREFFDALFGEGISVIGDAFHDSKVDNIPYIDFRGMRWTYYTVTLIGDPAMDIWTDAPGTLSVDLPSGISIPEGSIEIAVTDGTAPVEGARVTIFSDSTCYCHGFTGSDGLVHLDPALSQPGAVCVAVRAHDYYGFLDSIPVASAAGVTLLVESVTIDDDGAGASSGNSDGLVDAGETIEMPVALRNEGPLLADGISAILRCGDPHVTLADSSGGYADIPPGQVASPVWGFVFEVEPSAPDGHVIGFDLEITSADTVVSRHFGVDVQAPDLGLGPLSIDDTAGGNGDLCIEPGETFDLTLRVQNSGRGGAAGLGITVSENDPYASLTLGSAYMPLVGPDTTVTVSPAFEIGLLPGTPALHRLDLEVAIDLASGLALIESTAVYVGGLIDEDFEAGSPGWTHADIVAGFLDQWHLDTYRNHTGGGTQCWKFGGDGSTGYAHYAHGALVTPQLCLGANATLTFWHWIHAEMVTSTYASDGAIVEISTDDGETWSRIDPVGGYPHLIYPGTSTPIPPSTPCFGWTDVWTHVEFDLSAYHGAARIRFNFGGGENFAAEEGWYVDDVTVSDDLAGIVLDDDLEVMPARFALRRAKPNPAASGVALAFDVPYASRITIKVYDIRGREVYTVADGIFTPGSHSVGWKLPGNHSPGIYFIEMRAPGFSQARKVVAR
jgi:hypothetical protein